MPSSALTRWRTERSASLDEIEHAHESVGGAGRGRRHATEQINRAYAVLLCSQFQGFCRDLHTESVDAFLQEVRQPVLKESFRNLLMASRKLDQGNPNPGNIGSDFSRLGLKLWDE